MRRHAAVAGSFYPAKRTELLKLLESLVPPVKDAVKAAAVVSPHAGYIYSGPVAGAVFASVEVPQDVVVLGAPHADFGPRFSIISSGTWESPLADVEINDALAGLILGRSSLAEAAVYPHEDEHSIEVQVPFLQYRQKKLTLVPVHVNFRTNFAELDAFGASLADAVRDYGREVLVVASTDMSHYVDQESARKQDFLAIERILALDGKGLYDTVRKHKITMCGYQPTTAAIQCAKALGAAKGELVRYQTSGDVTGDRSQVVGYAGLRIY